jgi:hypothetical protein
MRTAWLYISIVLEMLFVASGIGLIVSAFVVLITNGRPDQFNEVAAAETAVAVLLLLYGVKRTWQSILRLEPETEIRFAQRHRMFRHGAAVGVTLAFAAAVGFGVVWADRAAKREKLSALMRQFEGVNSEFAQFKSRLADVRGREVASFEAYYAQSVEVEQLLDDHRPFVARRDQLFQQFVTAAQGDPKFVPVFSKIRKVYAKDDEILDALREAIRQAKELINLPPSKRAEFYRAKIEPIEGHIQQLANEEEMLKRQPR